MSDQRQLPQQLSHERVLACPVHGPDVDHVMTVAGERCAEILSDGAYCRLPLEAARMTGTQEPPR